MKKDSATGDKKEVNTNSDVFVENSTEEKSEVETEELSQTTQSTVKTTEEKQTTENTITKPENTTQAPNTSNTITQQTTEYVEIYNEPTTQAVVINATTEQMSTVQEPCNHEWVDDIIEHVDASAPVIKTEYHDVCNQCGAILDGGLATSHLVSNENCWSYTTNAGFNVQTGYCYSSFDWLKTQKCSICGETRDVSNKYIYYNLVEWNEPL